MLAFTSVVVGVAVLAVVIAVGLWLTRERKRPTQEELPDDGDSNVTTIRLKCTVCGNWELVDVGRVIRDPSCDHYKCRHCVCDLWR